MLKNYKVKKNSFLIIILLLFSLIIPGLSIIISILYLFIYNERLNFKQEKLIFFNISLALAILAFSINFGPKTGGDVYRYYLEMDKNYINNFNLFLNREKNIMNFGFYLPMYIIQNISFLPKNFLSFYSIFISYFSTFMILNEFRRQKLINNFFKISPLLVITFLYFISPYTLFTNYRTL